MVSEISQTEKNKYCVYHLYTESKKIQQTSECNIKKKKEADSQIQRTNCGYTQGGGKTEVGEQEIQTTGFIWEIVEDR